VSFPAYPAYRDSGIDWLGEVPADWRIQKFRFTFRESSEKIESEVVGPMLSVSGYRGIEVKEYGDENQRRAEEDLIGYRIVRPGQLVVNTMWLNYAGLGVSSHEGHVSPAYRAYWFADQNAEPRFTHYLLRSSIYVQGYTQLLTGIRPNSLQMSRADLMDFPVLLPPVSVQTVIAAFLDRETAKIDELIEEQRRLIALLKEKRQVVICHAVTKGLDPHALMKGSGIEWLGEVPAHWDIKPLKQLAARDTSITYGIVQAGPDIPDGVPYIRTSDMSGDQLPVEGYMRTSPEIDQAYARSRVSAGDLVIAIRATVGKPLIVPLFLEGANLTQGTAKFSPSVNISARFAQLVLGSVGASSEFDRISKGATFKEITLEMLRNFRVPVPPLDEQEVLTSTIDSQLRTFRELIDAAEESERLLTERRAALISAAVTGKIDVRKSAKVLSFPIDRARARGLVAAEVIERSAHQATFGRVKFQKIAFLAEGHVGISELAGSYTREAAGPLDRALIDEMESGARSIAGIVATQEGGTGTAVSYRLGQQRGAHRHELADWLGANRTAKLDKLIADFAGLTTKQAEAIATLYGVWNDALSEGHSPTDDEIVAGFLNDWHPEKREKFRASELPEWLGWMRRHDIVPTGFGPKTMTGRLFV
jgi:type I restriction enzyme S subunit